MPETAELIVSGTGDSQGGFTPWVLPCRPVSGVTFEAFQDPAHPRLGQCWPLHGQSWRGAAGATPAGVGPRACSPAWVWTWKGGDLL